MAAGGEATGAHDQVAGSRSGARDHHRLAVARRCAPGGVGNGRRRGLAHPTPAIAAPSRGSCGGAGAGCRLDQPHLRRRLVLGDRLGLGDHGPDVPRGGMDRGVIRAPPAARAACRTRLHRGKARASRRGGSLDRPVHVRRNPRIGPRPGRSRAPALETAGRRRHTDRGGAG